MSERLTILLTHQPEALVQTMVHWWRQHVPGCGVLVAYGGPRECFERLNFPAKVYVEDVRLRTKDHQRERQSYACVFAASTAWIQQNPGFRRILFAEFDCIPLCRDLLERMDARLEQEQADMLGCRLERVDGTNHPHYLYHSADPEFGRFLARLSCRADASVVLAMLGCVSYWRREAFLAVAAVQENPPLYLELALPTLAHHLGFRVRNLADQSPFVQPVGDLAAELEALRALGAWVAHPVKGYWEQATSAG